ncbi:MAG: Coenzyme F420 hydrogenase/dehydrogenase, beta subunit C-terminal domain, partial [Oscillibacter sp.]|nr:Coenzyme F420 hydrogenase/dehydrogenase, beta subunit C-terminal domain [Oscillibacter sp.]
KFGSMTVTYENGGVDSRPLYETEYGRAFGRSLLLRPSCYRCPYANLDRMGDFTLGDFWGLRRDEFPEEQRKGVSLLLVNTQKASRVFDNLPLECHPFPVERAAAGNPNLTRPTACPAERAEFFAAYAVEPFEDVRRRFLTVPPPALRQAKKLLGPALEAVRKRRKP